MRAPSRPAQLNPISSTKQPNASEPFTISSTPDLDISHPSNGPAPFEVRLTP